MATSAVEAMADRAMAAAQGGNDGKTSLYKYLLARLAQNARSAPARSNQEAIGRGLGTFLLPLIVQGMQSWKDRYDARGDFKASGAALLDKLSKGGQLTPNEQATLDNYKSKYPKEYAAALAAAQGGQTPPPQTTPQPAQPQGGQPPAGSGLSPAAQQYLKNSFDSADWQAQERPTPEALPQANDGAFSGVNYDDMWAQDKQRIMDDLQKLGQTPELEELLKMYGGLR